MDSSGERIIVKGMDISSLERGEGVLNWEHKNENASHIVGKILKAKKIFSEEDCEDQNQLHFWNKGKAPFVYIVGELFDGVGHQQAQEIAAMLKYDSMSRSEGTSKKNTINFSVEGAKLEKQGNDIVKSIARKVTVTVTPCNKAAVAEEMLQQPSEPVQKNSNPLSGMFKSEESQEIKVLEKYEPEMMEKTWKPSISNTKGAGHVVSFTHPEHGIVTVHQQGGQFHVKHAGSLAGLKGVKGSFGSAKEALGHAKAYTQAVSQGTVAPKQMHNIPSGAATGGKLKSSQEVKPSLKKAKEIWHHAGWNFTETKHPKTPSDHKAYHLVHKESGKTETLFAKHPKEIGSFIDKENLKMKSVKKNLGAAPGALTGTAALTREDLVRKMKKSIEEAFSTWPKAEELVKFIQHKRPDLTKSETVALAKMMAWKKTKKAEEALKALTASECEPTHEGSEKEELQKPYRSEAQRRWAHTPAGKKALGGEKAVKEWDSATKGKNLPEKISKEELAQDSKMKKAKGPCWEGYEKVPGKADYSKGSCKPAKKSEEVEKKDKPFEDYNPKKHSKEGGLNDKYREKYNRENGSHLKRPVTGKAKPGSEAAGRRKSFCARMSGVKGPTSKDGKLTPKGAALKRWKCS
jgi:hypothetical protein